MAECQSSGVESLPGSYSLQQIGASALDPGDPAAAAASVHRVSHYRVSHVLQVDPDLVGPAGVQLQAEQI
ncbi:MAG TPA: hypothetical protein VJU17_10745, partial [Gemmatimonadales bacterium]|nr:hypothetical protein [Gemmatimonadales bacterium]